MQNSLLLERLACCVNLFPQGESLYLWNGAIERAQECYALFKTSPELLERLEGFLREHHPYETPAILKGLCSSSENFFDYIMKHT